jgi:hypothetical protein
MRECELDLTQNKDQRWALTNKIMDVQISLISRNCFGTADLLTASVV